MPARLRDRVSAGASATLGVCPLRVEVVSEFHVSTTTPPLPSNLDAVQVWSEEHESGGLAVCVRLPDGVVHRITHAHLDATAAAVLFAFQSGVEWGRRQPWL